MTIEQYIAEHQDPLKYHWAVFLAKNGKKYLATDEGEIIGPSGIMRMRLFIAAQRKLWDYRDPEDGFPIGFVKWGIKESGLAELIEDHWASDSETYSNPEIAT